MFKRKGSAMVPADDVEKLLAAMEEIAKGNRDKVDVTQFSDKRYGERLNDVIDSFKKENNPYVMRMNDTVEAVGDNALIKQTFDQVHLLTELIEHMKGTSFDMENSIQNISASVGGIRSNTHQMMSKFQTITPNMDESIRSVGETSLQMQNINEQMKLFQKNIGKISEIVGVVKKISFQSSLLSLNASIEAEKAGQAGRGFAVVASKMRQLSVSTTEYAENITEYIAQLDKSTRELADAVNETAAKLEEGNVKAKASLGDMLMMNSQIVHINEQLDSIFGDVDTQTGATAEFSKQIDNLSESYSALSDNCLELGKHIFKIGRYVDKTRSDMVRNSSDITMLDWIRVFQVDHFILLWRVYNNIVGFERLKAQQVNAPDKCKLGKWISRQDNKSLTESAEFGRLKTSHNAVHHFATLSWEANEDGKKELAMEYFEKTYQSFMVFDKAIAEISRLLKSVGKSEYTEIVGFKNV